MRSICILDWYMILFQMEWRREIGRELALVKIWLSDFNPRELLCRDAVQSAKNLPTSHNKEGFS